MTLKEYKKTSTSSKKACSGFSKGDKKNDF